MRIAQEIQDNPGRHNWKLIAEEHPWNDPESAESGFIDIVAGFGAVRLVIECMRGADATWVFLTRKGDRTVSDTVDVLCTDSQEDQPDINEWCRMRLSPTSPLAAFCIVRGQAEKEPMLERVASSLLLSTEALAREELQLDNQKHFRNYRFYIPVIVTTAQLQVCRLNPSDVDLKNGKVEEVQVEYEKAPSLRFRKAFGTLNEHAVAESLEEVHIESMRTVIVVNAAELASFLNQMDLKQQSDLGGWPQNLIRARMKNPPTDE